IHTLLEAMVLVFLVVFIFLKNWRTTVIPCLAVPVSIVGAFAGMYALGFSINTLTMFGLVLAIGIVVDDAIIVIENVERIMEEEKIPVREATIKAMGEVSGPVVAVVLVLCAVFIPIAFMGGFTGVMYQQFAVTIAVSVVLSGLVALTLTPALCVLLLKEKPSAGFLSFFFDWFDKTFAAVANFYMTIVNFFLNKKIISFTILAVILSGLVFLYGRVPSALVPDEDQGMIMGVLMLDKSASLNSTIVAAQKAEEILLKEGLIVQELTLAGYNMLSGTSENNVAAFFVSLKDWKERTKKSDSAMNLVTKLSAVLSSSIAEGYAVMFNPPAILGLSTTGGIEGYIQNKCDASDKELEAKVNEFITALGSRKEITGTATTFNASTPQLKLEVDEIKAKSMGVSLDDLYTTIQGTFGTSYINDFNKLGRSFKVLMQAKGDYRSQASDISNIYVRSQMGQMVSLQSLVTLTQIMGTDTVERFNIFPAAKILTNPAPGYSSGDAMNA
ncbi:MAG: efflux RND transporter permease subunit, partial [Elusimicrobia bacterium]|nr:efflux RND transporter permease subunit [Elusimicrobiota bacterium]